MSTLRAFDVTPHVA
jgi:hypothetical protein